MVSVSRTLNVRWLSVRCESDAVYSLKEGEESERLQTDICTQREQKSGRTGTGSRLELSVAIDYLGRRLQPQTDSACSPVALRHSATPRRGSQTDNRRMRSTKSCLHRMRAPWKPALHAPVAQSSLSQRRKLEIISMYFFSKGWLQAPYIQAYLYISLNVFLNTFLNLGL